MKKIVIPFVVLLSLVLSACGSDPIETVKSGVLPIDESLTVGDALNNYKYFSNKKWIAFKDKQNREVVQFTGDMDYSKYVGSSLRFIELTAKQLEKTEAKLGDMQISYVVQFYMSKSGDRFSVGYSGLDINGTDKNSGKKFSKSIKDNDLSTLKEVYTNKPETATLALLITGG